MSKIQMQGNCNFPFPWRGLFLGGGSAFRVAKSYVILARMIAHQKIFSRGRFNFWNARITAALRKNTSAVYL